METGLKSDERFYSTGILLLCVQIQRLMLSRVRAGDVDMVETIHRSSQPVLDLMVDAVRGYIYWTTASTVEMARLDGQSHSVIFRSSSTDLSICCSLENSQ